MGVGANRFWMGRPFLAPEPQVWVLGIGLSGRYPAAGGLHGVAVGGAVMSRIELTGLKSGTPIVFMAALGAFRQASRIGELGGVRLAWTPHAGQWCAVLNTEEAVEFDAFVRLFLERLKALGER